MPTRAGLYAGTLAVCGLIIGCVPAATPKGTEVLGWDRSSQAAPACAVLVQFTEAASRTERFVDDELAEGSGESIGYIYLPEDESNKDYASMPVEMRFPVGQAVKAFRNLSVVAESVAMGGAAKTDAEQAMQDVLRAVDVIKTEVAGLGIAC